MVNAKRKRTNGEQMIKSIRTQIRVTFALILAVAIALSCWFYWGTICADRSMKQAQWAYEELQVLTKLSADAGSHFGQVAQTLLLGENGSKLQATKVQLEKSFDEMITLRDLQSKAGRVESDAEINRVRDLYVAYRQLASESEMIATLSQIGKTEDARERFLPFCQQLETKFKASIHLAIEAQAKHVAKHVQAAERLSLMLRSTTIGAAVFLVVMSLVLSFRIIDSVMRPTQELMKGVAAFAQGDLQYRVPCEGENELSIFARAFNDLAQKLDEHHRKLAEAGAFLQNQNAELKLQMSQRIWAEEQLKLKQSELCSASRRAGMADVATGVLHNVGNVLNSVNVAASVVTDCVRASELPLLAKAVSLVESHRDDLPEFLTNDEHGKHLPEFLSAIARQLAMEQNTVTSELQSLTKNIEHIKEIVVMQQNYARHGAVSEELHLPDVLTEAQRMSTASLERHEIQLVKDFKELPPIKTDKHVLLQVLINLITNAKYALNENRQQATPRRITLGLWRDSETQEAVITVSDTGIGIPGENMKRLFTQGFSTRANGHGFGLHASALAARDMGGSISAASDGVGKGATFTLRIPYQKQGEKSLENATTNGLSGHSIPAETQKPEAAI